ncbi:hypothetical protein HMPREF1326_00525 [Akkermansia sp. KLE1605]|nr:hypothetical protein HMPREF1326_00525 [Akkermansia sp. KLE1605]
MESRVFPYSADFRRKDRFFSVQEGRKGVAGWRLLLEKRLEGRESGLSEMSGSAPFLFQ